MLITWSFVCGGAHAHCYKGVEGASYVVLILEIKEISRRRNTHARAPHRSPPSSLLVLRFFWVAVETRALVIGVHQHRSDQ